MKLKKIYLLLFLLLFLTPVKSETEYSFYAGTFDTIDNPMGERQSSPNV